MSVAEDYPTLNTLPAEGQYGLLRDRMDAEAQRALLEIARLRADNRRYQGREAPEVNAAAVDHASEFGSIQAQLADLTRRVSAMQEWMATQQARAVPKAKRA